MPNWLSGLRSKKPQESAAPSDDPLTVEAELQHLRLELEQRDRSLAQLKSEVERRRGGESARAAEAAQARVRQLLTDAAGPAAQLVTQAYLLDVAGKPVQPRDLLTVAQRLVRALEQNGMALEGAVGETLPFDANRHAPLRAGDALRAGQPVVVRFVGVSYQGEVLRKAGVERAGD